jgi:hypothetical protein
MGITALCFSSCIATHSPIQTGNFTPLSSTPCQDKPTYIHLFFEGEKIDFDYEKVGLIESTSSGTSFTEAILDDMKYQAWQNCADGIIQIKKTQKYWESSAVTDSNHVRNDVYNTTSFTGIAVRILPDATISKKYENKIDTSFISRVHANQEQKKQVQKKAVSSVIVLWFVTIVVSLAVLSSMQ